MRVWPAGKTASPEHALITDPCLLGDTAQVLRQLVALGYALPDLGTIFVTHAHHDHMPVIDHAIQEGLATVEEIKIRFYRTNSM